MWAHICWTTQRWEVIYNVSLAPVSSKTTLEDKNYVREKLKRLQITDNCKRLPSYIWWIFWGKKKEVCAADIQGQFLSTITPLALTNCCQQHLLSSTRCMSQCALSWPSLVLQSQKRVCLNFVRAMVERMNVRKHIFLILHRTSVMSSTTRPRIVLTVQWLMKM